MSVDAITTQKRIRVQREDYPESPREGDNLGTMYCWHRRYNLGDRQPTDHPEDVMLELLFECDLSYTDCLDIVWGIVRWHKDAAEDFFHAMGRSPITKYNILSSLDSVELWPDSAQTILDKYYVILPLYLYDHSGITISTTPFSCPWDSGQVGFIAAEISDDMDRGATMSVLQGEVSTYDDYLRGEVYGYIVEELDADTGVWEETDSCWGFYGRNVESNGMLEQVPEDLQAALKEAAN